MDRPAVICRISAQAVSSSRGNCEESLAGCIVLCWLRYSPAGSSPVAAIRHLWNLISVFFYIGLRARSTLKCPACGRLAFDTRIDHFEWPPDPVSASSAAFVSDDHGTKAPRLTRCHRASSVGNKDQEVRSLQHGNDRWFEHMHQGSSAHPRSGTLHYGRSGRDCICDLRAGGVSVLLLFAWSYALGRPS